MTTKKNVPRRFAAYPRGRAVGLGVAPLTSPHGFQRCCYTAVPNCSLWKSHNFQEPVGRSGHRAPHTAAATSYPPSLRYWVSLHVTVVCSKCPVSEQSRICDGKERGKSPATERG
jgi:hypothetical protein